MIRHAQLSPVMLHLHSVLSARISLVPHPLHWPLKCTHKSADWSKHRACRQASVLIAVVYSLLQLGAGVLPQYNMQAYNRNVVLAPHGNGWTPPGVCLSAPQ